MFIRGETRLDLNILHKDIEMLKKSEPGIFIKAQMSNPLVIFIQTPDMLGCTKCFSEVILITVAKRRKNRYGFIQVCISSLNNYGKVIILALGYLNIECKAGYQGVLQKFVERMNDEGIRMPRIVVTNMEAELIEAKNICFPASLHLIN